VSVLCSHLILKILKYVVRKFQIEREQVPIFTVDAAEVGGDGSLNEVWPGSYRLLLEAVYLLVTVGELVLEHRLL